ncbi:MAG: hypothetical protein JWQ01_2175, partial [Massilia sp.]|nr:hypothetical protein [Massilia sp.]
MRALAALLFALAAPVANAEQVHGFHFHIVTGDDSAQTRHIADD